MSLYMFCKLKADRLRNVNKKSKRFQCSNMSAVYYRWELDSVSFKIVIYVTCNCLITVSRQTKCFDVDFCMTTIGLQLFYLQHKASFYVKYLTVHWHSSSIMGCNLDSHHKIQKFRFIIPYSQFNT